MKRVTIYLARPGSSHKKLPAIELEAIPRVGDLVWYRNSITGVTRSVKVKAVEHEIEVGDQGTGQKISLYCKTFKNDPAVAKGQY